MHMLHNKFTTLLVFICTESNCDILCLYSNNNAVCEVITHICRYVLESFYSHL